MGSIGWIGTLNNYTEDDIDQFRAFAVEHCKYFIFQREVGEGAGTPHLQAYIRLLRKNRLSYIRQRLVTRWHWEPQRGSHEQARDYCSKAETREAGTEPESGGVEPEQGKRSDIAEFVKAIQAGDSDRELLEKHPSAYFLHGSKIDRIREITRPRAVYAKPVVNVYYGETGTGKSRAVDEELADTEFWKAIPGGGKWFDGYESQEAAWFDDYRGEIGYSLFLNILDGYGTRVEKKGSTCWFKPKRIYITSNAHPDSWYVYDDKNPYSALKRRISCCKSFSKTGTKVVIKTEWDDEEVASSQDL